MDKKIVRSYNKALDWVKNNTIREQGIIVNSQQKIPYLEVTGYLIPTLIETGEYNLALRYAEFLSYMQRPDGSFAGPDGKEYVFDSAQALRGLSFISRMQARFKPHAIKTAEYLLSSMEPSGRIPATYSREITEYVHVYAVSTLFDAGISLSVPWYIEKARKAINFYKNSKDILDINRLTHFLAYIVDGFIEAGEKDFVMPLVRQVFALQNKNGSIPAFPGTNWICSTGVAQFAVIGYKLGMKKEADKAVDYLCNTQNQSGGFFGSYGFRAKYFPKAEISWANKFFIDALNLKIKYEKKYDLKAPVGQTMA